MASKATQAESVGWKLQTQLGEGGQASVFRAVRTSDPHGQVYAFKFLNDKGSAKARQRFRQELSALASLNHPGIVKIVDHAQQDAGLQYYVMDYAEGAESLRRRMERGNNPFASDPLKAVDGFIQIVQALAACEKLNIVHRDLSPANVLVMPDGRIVLIDFGLCHIEGTQTITFTEEAVGTPHYRAPECAGNSNFIPDIRADLYGAGKLLWSMITNQTAFDREAPVFNNLALCRVLAELESAWHLHHIFEFAVRYEPMKRFDNTARALEMARTVRRLIVQGYKPLERLAEDLCPHCGLGRYGPNISFHTYFAKEMDAFGRCMAPVSGAYAVCPVCFHASFVAKDALKKVLSDRAKLQ